MELVSLLVAGGTGGLIGSLLTWSLGRKRILVENVTQERRHWRDKVRAMALEVHDAMVYGNDRKIERLRKEFRALLNPHDCEDTKLIDCIRSGCPQAERAQHTDEFALRVSYLLKHDWERAKSETDLAIKIWILRPQRRTLTASVGCCEEGGCPAKAGTFCSCPKCMCPNRHRFRLRIGRLLGLMVVVGVSWAVLANGTNSAKSEPSPSTAPATSLGRG